MFQTLQPETFRINKTAIPKNRRRNIDLNLQERPATFDPDRHGFLMTSK